MSSLRVDGVKSGGRTPTLDSSGAWWLEMLLVFQRLRDWFFGFVWGFGSGGGFLSLLKAFKFGDCS